MAAGRCDISTGSLCDRQTAPRTTDKGESSVCRTLCTLVVQLTQSIFGCFIFLLVVKIAPPVKGGIMDNVIVKDNKASRESLDTANSKITRTRLILASFWIRINFHKCQSDGSFNVG